MEKEVLFEKRMKELSKNAYYRGVLTFSDFLDLNELHMLHSLTKNESGVREWGDLRRLCIGRASDGSIIPDALFFQQDYPISCIQIRPAAEKFAREPDAQGLSGSHIKPGY